ncbi:MAG: hypothetical protein LC802_12680 [Acidobacteria bacterium]|nr:hypothetical protein [Acidobacteriota bacterium]
MSRRLEELLGYGVVQRDCATASSAKINRQKISLVILSPTATEHVSAEFRNVAVPVVVMDRRLYAGMGLTGPSEVSDFGTQSGEQQQVLIMDPNHPIAADLTGSQELAAAPAGITWGLPGRRARRVATLATDTRKAVLFCYDSDDTMNGLNAPARRVALLYDEAFRLHPASPYWRLFDAAVEWAAAERPRQFPDVFRAEWSEVRTRRRAGQPAGEAESGSPPMHPPENLAGLALSGGGIRAATFSLGLLQGLNLHGLLRGFDYLSTVSGGGYVGGWWSAWLSRDPQGQRGGEGAFPPPELIRPASDGVARLAAERVNTEVADELLSAGRDPIHHLRLFSNYLTPRKGVLSPDTWRAVTVISRDMALTWVVLLPVLIAALLLGKLYFVLQPLAYDTQSHHSFFQYSLPPGQSLWEWALWPRLILVMWPLLLVLGWLAVAVCAWMVSGGAEESRREWWAAKLGGTVATIMIGLFFYLFYYRSGSGESGTPGWFWPALALGSVVLLGYCFYPMLRRLIVEQRGGEEQAARQWRGEVLRDRMTRAQSLLMVVLAIAAFVLVLAGFGHELVNYVFKPESGLVARGGGGLAVLAALAGSVFTALKNSPSGGSDERLLDENQSRFNRLVFRLTPPLLIVVLAVALSWAANVLLGYIHSAYLDGLNLIPNELDYLRVRLSWVKQRQGGTNLTTLLMAATCLGALLSFFLVLVETRWRIASPRRWLAALWLGLALYLSALVVWMLVVAPYPPTRCADEPVINFLLKVCDNPSGSAKRTLDWRCLANWELCLDRRAFGAIFFLTYVTGWWLIFRLRAGERRRPRRMVTPALILLVGVVLTILTTVAMKAAYNTQELKKDAAAIRWAKQLQKETEAAPASKEPAQGTVKSAGVKTEEEAAADEMMWVPMWFTVMLSGAFLYCLLFVVLETVLGSTDNRRAMWLLTSVYLALNALLAVYIAFDYSDLRADYLNQPRLDLYITVVLGQATFGLFGVSLTWVVAMGWMADPNRLSLHNFYRARLVRAYLGASNKYRSEQLRTIREAVEGDDVLLQDLGNCRRGAPYHLINTTLNLVGGRDLTTAQRSADSFILSRRFCGSSRTGYRDTREYMGGQLSLGTAVAVSGAAASPNMGSKTLTSSLAMLMTFLNVRLGFWAPTPNKKDWRETRARLWPFYMLREFTSQTNDLSTYCYLTDGGHFDNTGLYALVERGCRFIFVADCGADPKPCFQDVGAALRRCRIDFGSEIDLDLTPVTRKRDDGLADSHFAVGSILYSREHAEALGWELPPAAAARATDEGQRADELARTGVIILFKPVVTGRDEPADVRQFKLENSLFPQQTTADQWFDEAQFESYRRLGHLSAYSVLRRLSPVRRPLAPAGAPPDPN